MAPTVEELVKTSTLLAPPKYQSLEEYSRDYRQRPRNLSASHWTDITTLPDARKALLDSYRGLTSARQALDTFKPSATTEALVEGFRKSHRETVNRVLEALRPKVNVFALWVANTLEVLRRAAQAAWPTDPYGAPVPRHNAHVYLLARWAYQGDYEARAAFLDEIGADLSADNVLYIENLLGPTFAPDRLDLREPWERKAPKEARRWLRDRLKDVRNEDGRSKHIILPYEHDEGEERVGEEDLALFAIEEAGAFEARQGELRYTLNGLPERRLQVAKFRAEGLTYKQIASELGNSESSVKTHMQLLHHDPALRRLHESW